MFKAKIVSIFLIPAAAAFSFMAGVIYKGIDEPLFDLEVLKKTAILSLACALAQDILPRSFKEAVIFWRIRDRLPGHRAFLTQKTDRYDLSKITNMEQLAALPADKQQRVFYDVYKKHRDDPTVSQSNFRYVAWRDTASLFFCLGVISIPVAYLVARSLAQPFEWRSAVMLATSAFVAYLLTSLAARQVANSLVSQVLSCETAGHPHGISC